MKESWFRGASIYFEPRLISILFLGFASGLPLWLTGGTLSIWLTESGVSKATIGAFSLVGLPYTLKFVWAPLMDHFSLPFLTRKLGRRRSWMIFTQLMLMFSLLGLGSTNPSIDPWLTAMFALVVAFCSASQDIVIDAFRVDILDTKTYGAGAANVVFGYRIGILVAGAGALYLATYLPWQIVYSIMAALVGVGMTVVLLSKEPENISIRVDSPKTLASWFQKVAFEPFSDFMKREQWALVLLLIVSYKLSDAFISGMSNTFYLELGFTKIDIANVTKIFGLAATLVGGLIGGIVTSRLGIMRAMLVCGIIHLIANFGFVVQALAGPELPILMLTIALENVTGGMTTVALVAFISSLCNVSYTATQYALLSSFMAIGRTFLSSSAGLVAENLNWPSYFVFSSMLALPGLTILLWLMRQQRVKAYE